MKKSGLAGRKRYIGGSLVCILALLLAAAIGGIPVFVHPQIDPVRPADAVIVLGGPGYSRYGLGFQLATAGFAPTLVISNPNGARDVHMTKRCEATDERFRLICFVPDPATTRGEAVELARLAKQYGWKTVIVVTSRPHISRARLILEQCFHEELIMVAFQSNPSLLRWAFEYFYQGTGYIKAALESSC